MSLNHHQNSTCGVSPLMKWGQHPPATYANMTPGAAAHFETGPPYIWHPAGVQGISERK